MIKSRERVQWGFLISGNDGKFANRTFQQFHRYENEIKKSAKCKYCKWKCLVNRNLKYIFCATKLQDKPSDDANICTCDTFIERVSTWMDGASDKWQVYYIRCDTNRVLSFAAPHIFHLLFCAKRTYILHSEFGDGDCFSPWNKEYGISLIVVGYINIFARSIHIQCVRCMDDITKSERKQFAFLFVYAIHRYCGWQINFLHLPQDSVRLRHFPFVLDMAIVQLYSIIRPPSIWWFAVEKSGFYWKSLRNTVTFYQEFEINLFKWSIFLTLIQFTLKVILFGRILFYSAPKT